MPISPARATKREDFENELTAPDLELSRGLSRQTVKCYRGKPVVPSLKLTSAGGAQDYCCMLSCTGK